MRNLFDIQEEYLIIMDELEQFFQDNPEAEGELPLYFADRLAINREDAENKVNGYFYVIKQLESEMDALDFEIKRLRAKRDAKAAIIDRLKRVVADAVQVFGTVKKGAKSKSIATDKMKASFINIPKVEVINIDAVPDKYKAIDIDINHLSIAEAKGLITVLTNLGVGFIPTVQVDKKALKGEAEMQVAIAKVENREPELPEGIQYDADSGYVRFT